MEKHCEKEYIEIIDITIWRGYDFSQDPWVTWKTIGNILHNFYWGCARKKRQAFRIWIGLKSQSTSVKLKLT